MTQPTVSAGLVAGLLRFSVSLGADADVLCKIASIERDLLGNPDSRVPLPCYITLMRAAQKATDNPALALHYGEGVGMSEISIVGLLMEASSTIGEAYIQMRRYGRLAMEIDAISKGPRFELAQDNGKMFLVDQQWMVDEFREVTESGFAWLVCGPRRYLDKSPVVSAQVTWPAPSYWKEYERVLRCPVEFDAKWNALEMHPESFSWPVAQNPKYVFGVLTERANALLAELEAAHSTSGQLQTLLASVLHHGDISADAMAQKMRISRQTLFRRLKDEGATFTEILDNLRQRLAIEYLKGGKTSVNETAYLVGFSDAAAFTRAFKRWTGKNPGEFRRSHAP